jgi:hypothetical protein
MQIVAYTVLTTLAGLPGLLSILKCDHRKEGRTEKKCLEMPLNFTGDTDDFDTM